MTDKRFKVAFSFAGEKREFVAKTAELLSQRFDEERILYDKYHEAEFARYDLGIRLPKLYGEQSELIVPVLCSNYDSKRWTGWEWMHIYGLLTKPDAHRVMLSRFDYAEADGLGPAAGFIELNGKTPEEFSRLILERLAINQDKPRDYYLYVEQSTKANPAMGGVIETSDPDPEMLAAWCDRDRVFAGVEFFARERGGLIVLHGTRQQLRATCLTRRFATELTNDSQIPCKAVSLLKQLNDAEAFEMAVYQRIPELKNGANRRDVSAIRTAAAAWLIDCKYQALLIDTPWTQRALPSQCNWRSSFAWRIPPGTTWPLWVLQWFYC